MRQRAPWWSFVMAAVVALVALLTPAWHKSAYGLNGLQPISQARAAAMNASTVAAQIDPGLVLINTGLSYQGAVGAGTGIVLSPNGEVLTNNHVVEGATQITATNVGTGATYPATVVGYDRTHDIAVLQLQGATGLPTAPIGKSSNVAVGDPVLAIGNAGGQGLSDARGTVTNLGQTIVAADDLAAAEQLHGMIQTNANIRAGDSGGPLVDNSGQVIGIDTAASPTYRLSGRGGAQGFAIPIDTALSIASQIESGASSGSVHIGDTAMLGVGVGTSAGQAGVPVRQVLPGSPAGQAGIVPGDVITGFDGNAVSSDTALTDLLDQHHPGAGVNVSWRDQSGQQHTADITLATGPVG
ncbi:S1C family serine protease [Mycobacterium sp.]|uniref:S1C family serine protease n=1 Tax=Mycobacterium sp. TaxID=1785 RepID=UPI002D796A74|nr:trypsin-like peptidase domain-containing protein [Mycobacterium sp.]